MRVLIIGGGGREHALAWKLAQSSELDELYCIPGNAGIASVATCDAEIDPSDEEALVKWTLDKKINLTVVGPEAPLVSGLADAFRRAGLQIFGPGSDGARLEGSKVWAKEMMARWGIPTAPFAVYDSFDQARRYLDSRPEGPLVVKADGLAAGKGVTVAENLAEAEEALRLIMIERAFGTAGRRVVLEERLVGEEVSVLAITDGNALLVLPSAQDHKAIGEGDTGPNTGGMGAYSPAPFFTPALAQRVLDEIFYPLLAGLRELGIDYRGVLYAGLMVSGNRFHVLEFNVRFGDPETQAILPRLQSDLLPVLKGAAAGRLPAEMPAWCDDPAVCVILAADGYPGSYQRGHRIDGLDRLSRDGQDKLAVFHAGTAFKDGVLVTNGGRVLGVTAWDRTLPEAVYRVYSAVEQISFPGCYYRRDIAYRSLNR